MDARYYNGEPGPEHDPGRVEDSYLERAAQRAVEAGERCRQYIRWAQEVQGDAPLDHVYVEACDAFSWAREALADTYCEVHQKPLLMGDYGHLASNCEECDGGEPRTFDEQLGAVCDAQERYREAWALKRR